MRNGCAVASAEMKKLGRANGADMSLFGKIVRTTVNVALLPVAAAKDVLTLGNAANYPQGSFTGQQIEKIKEEAEDE